MTPGWILTHNGSKHTLCRKEVPFRVHTMANNILGFKFPQNCQKWPSIGTLERPQKNSNEWRHRKLTSFASLCRSLAIIGQAAYTIYRILGITVVLYFPMITHNTTIVSADALHSVWKFSSGKVYIAFVGNLFYRLSHNKIPCAVCGKASKSLKLWYASGGH